MIVDDKGSGNSYKQPPIGSHVARCVHIIDIGTHENNYLGDISYKHQLHITWELPTEILEYEKDGEVIKRPYTISEYYTASLNEKARLCIMLEGWRGRAFTEEERAGFDLNNVLGQPCMLNIINKPNQKGEDRSRVAGASKLPKGFDCPEAVHELISFDLDNFDQAQFDKISEGLQNKIKQSEEWQQRENPAPVDHTRPQTEVTQPPENFDDIPF